LQDAHNAAWACAGIGLSWVAPAFSGWAQVAGADMANASATMNICFFILGFSVLGTDSMMRTVREKAMAGS
jgi:hypothetical protein